MGRFNQFTKRSSAAVPARGATRIFTLMRYVLASALRDRLFMALLLTLALAGSLSVFLGGSAIVEQQQMVAAYMGATSRAILIAGAVLFVAFHVQRALESGEITLILSRPVSRPAFILAYAASLVTVATICALFAALLVAVAAHPPLDGFARWGATLLLEVNLLALVAMLIGLVLRSAISTSLACLGFYVLGRMSGLLGALAEQAVDGTSVDRFLGRSFEIVSLIIPRLDFFAQSEWLVHGAGDAQLPLAYAVAQSLVFIPFLLALAVFDFSRKQL